MPDEELCDLDTDPHEITNLAASTTPEHQAALKRLRGVLEKWIEEVGDQGHVFESAEVVKEASAKPDANTKPKRKSDAGK